MLVYLEDTPTFQTVLQGFDGCWLEKTGPENVDQSSQTARKICVTRKVEGLEYWSGLLGLLSVDGWSVDLGNVWWPSLAPHRALSRFIIFASKMPSISIQGTFFASEAGWCWFGCCISWRWLRWFWILIFSPKFAPQTFRILPAVLNSQVLKWLYASCFVYLFSSIHLVRSLDKILQ